ncbi:MAG TPA: hypothetical protein VEQ63_03545 [Bryobacteraceae bacterium]|nr:hypothetical protein [Bryobacteraceae bacterium]
MKLLLSLWILGALLQPVAYGQDYWKHTVQVEAGVAQPKRELKGLFDRSFLVGAFYGYRFWEFLQADAGFETAFGAAGVRDFLPTAFGDLRIRDYQHFLPFGGRAILPLANERIHIYGGGGGAYIRYTERVRQPFADSGFRIDCSVCSSRDGFGYYAVVGGSVALNSGRNFRLGVAGRMYRGETDGDPLGSAPPRRTDDQWSNITATLSFSF